MKQQTKQWLAIGAGVVVLYLLLKPKKVTTASSAEDKMKLADQPADAELRNPRPTEKGGLSMEKFRKKNYVDVNSNSFFQTVSTRDPRDIKV